MALNLNQLANGGPVQSSPIQPTQQVTILPYSQTLDCQNTGPINPTKASTAIAPTNLVTGSCGQVVLNFDASATSITTDQEIAFGGPYVYPNQNNWYLTTNRAAGFGTAAFLVAIVGAAAQVAGQTWGNARGVAIVNSLAQTRSWLLSGVMAYRIDTSTTANNNFVNSTLRPFTYTEGNSYTITESGAKIRSTITTTGSGNVVDVTWTFSNPIPLSSDAGFLWSIPAGFHNDVYFCVSAVQTNRDYTEGCAN